MGHCPQPKRSRIRGIFLNQSIFPRVRKCPRPSTGARASTLTETPPASQHRQRGQPSPGGVHPFRSGPPSRSGQARPTPGAPPARSRALLPNRTQPQLGHPSHPCTTPCAGTALGRKPGSAFCEGRRNRCVSGVRGQGSFRTPGRPARAPTQSERGPRGQEDRDGPASGAAPTPQARSARPRPRGRRPPGSGPAQARAADAAAGPQCAGAGARAGADARGRPRPAPGREGRAGRWRAGGAGPRCGPGPWPPPMPR